MDQVSREQEITLTAALKGICPATEVKGNILKTEANEMTASVIRGMAMAFLKQNRERSISHIYTKTLTAWCDSKYYSINEDGKIELIVNLEETSAAASTEATESDKIEYISLDDIDFSGDNSLKFDLYRWNICEMLELIEHIPSRLGLIKSEIILDSFVPASTTNIAGCRKDAAEIFRDRCMANYESWVKRNRTDNPCYKYDSFYVGDVEYCVERKTGRIFAA